MQLNQLLRQALQKEIPILTREIRAVYTALDRRFHLQGASVPVTFGFETDTLGSYTQKSENSEEEFHFSLLFLARCVAKPLTKEERLDVFRHEYAHYMQYHMAIPKEHNWQYGTHGSAWKYCCSLIGAAPTPFYKAGEHRVNHDYEKVLRNPIHDKTVPIRDTYRREQEYKKAKESIVHYEVGERVHHPKYGHGEIMKIGTQPGSVRLHIQFKEELKIIDQKWLLKTKYKG